MAKKADIGGKRLISLAPDNWVKWVTQRDELEVREIIGSDFQWISRDNDSLIRTYSPKTNRNFWSSMNYNFAIVTKCRDECGLTQD